MHTFYSAQPIKYVSDLNTSAEPIRIHQLRTVGKIVSDKPNTKSIQQDETERSLLKLAGILTDEEADAMRTAIRERRQRNAEAADQVVDLLDS